MTEELHKFLNDHNVFHPLDTKGGYVITYNGFKCFAQLTTAPNVEMLTIRPCSAQWDIGAGAGQTIYREFRIKSITPNEAFNQGIDAAIELINGRIPSYSNSDLLKVEKEAFLLLFNNLISQLESLKKK